MKLYSRLFSVLSAGAGVYLMSNIGFGLLGFILAIVILVAWHEFGHFIIAKLFGVRVEVFSIGFGPRLVHWTWGETEYRISAIPMGGFVKMTGEGPDAEVPEDLIHRSFHHANRAKKIAIVAAGPLFNIVMAILLLAGIVFVNGIQTPLPYIGEVKENSAAAKAGIQPGDKVVEVDGNEVATWQDMGIYLQFSGGKEISMTVERDGRLIPLRVTPGVTEQNKMKVYILGVQFSGKEEHVIIEKPGVFRSVGYGVERTYLIVKLNVVAIGKMINGDISRDNVGGPLMIAKMAGDALEQGILQFIGMLVMLNIILGIMNLLPIPVLDGGHILTFTIEAVLRRDLNTKAKQYAQLVGMGMLLMLMLFATFNDIVRFFF